MTIKEKKSYLKQYKDIIESINDVNKKLSILDLKAIPGGVRYDKINVQTSPTNDQFINICIEREELEETLKAMERKSYTICNDIIKTINTLENTLYRNILFKRYILLEDWDYIAYELNYSVAYIYELQGDAICELQVPRKS